ncbi:MAG: hypothetical protein IKR50_03300 [Prevotella sp.]|nr:hypothetical protein [Prevotella sp.]
MKNRFLWMLAAILASGFGAVLTSCNWTEAKVLPVAGTLDAELGALNAERSPFNSQSSTFSVMSDTVAGVSVFGIDRVDTVSTQGYGIVVVKGATQTTFPNIRNVRQPQAKYDREADVLWLTSSAMEGTGVQVEWLCQIAFDANDSAYMAHVVDPYDVQQQLRQRLGYRIDGQQLTLFDGQRPLATTTNTVADMGGFDDEQPLWIGEQLRYDLTGDAPQLLVTPGLKFTTGLVLIYDDMPTLGALLAIAPDGHVEIGDMHNCE